MKAIVNAKEFRDAVSWVSKVVKAHPHLPILQYLMLSASPSRLTVKATDLNMTLVRHIKADVQETSDVLIKAKELKDYLKGIKNATLTLDSTDKAMTVRVDSAYMTFHGLNPAEFPNTPQEVAWDHAIPFDPIEAMLPEIIKFTSPEEDRAVLQCVLVEVYDNGLRLTAADGFRLVSTNAISGEPIGSYLLPAKAIKSMIALKAKGTLCFKKMLADFTTDNSRVQCVLVDGRFPDFAAIIPAEDRGTWASFDRAELKMALETMATVTNATKRYRERPTTLRLYNNKATLSATSEDRNELETSLEVDWNGKEFAIGFNAKYMLDCLPFCGNKTEIMLQEPYPPVLREDGTPSSSMPTPSGKPILVKGINVVMVVMPMHIQK